MRHLLLLLAFSFTAMFSQTIPNGGFEDWTTKTNYQPSDGATRITFGDTISGVERYEVSTNNYALKLSTTALSDDTNGAYVLYGQVKDNVFKGIPYTGACPKNIHFKYKADMQGTDSSEVWVRFYQGGSEIYNDVIKLGTQVILSEVSFALGLGGGDAPDSVFVAYACGNPMGDDNAVGSYIIYDDVYFTDASQNQIPMYNGDFESWEDLNSYLLMEAAEPNSDNFERTEDASAGSYALKITTEGNALEGYGGYMEMYGDLGWDGQSPSLTGGIAIPENFVAIAFDYKYTLVNSNQPDTAEMTFQLHSDRESTVYSQKYLPPTEVYKRDTLWMNIYHELYDYSSFRFVLELNSSKWRGEGVTLGYNQAGNSLYLDNIEYITQLEPSNVVCTGGTWGSGQAFASMQEGVFSLGTVMDANASYSALIDADFFMPEGAQGQSYAFGLVKAVGIPSTVEDFDIAGKNGSADPITVNFSGVTNLDYVAYCGDTLIGYSYDGDNLSITFAATTAAASGGNTTGGQTLFGMLIVTNAESGFEGAVFRTDMYWGDIAMQKVGGDYGMTSSLPGCNYYGLNNAMLSFDYYIKQDVLENLSMQPVTHLDNCKFRFKKENGNEVNPMKTVKYYTIDGNPTAWGGSAVPKQSIFDFDGGDSDNYVNMHVQNDSWSMANGYVYGDETTGIEYAEIEGCQIFTNDKMISVKFDDITNANVRLINMAGQTLLQESVNGTMLNINVPEVGLYILQVNEQNRSYTKKILIE